MVKYSVKLEDVTSITDIIRAIDATGVGFLAFVDCHNKLIGVVTDGDLRRSILKDCSSVKEVINYNPITMLEGSLEVSIVSKLKTLHRRHMPLVDEENNLKEIFILDEYEICSKENHVVIMAGGLGSRLGELTKNIPKPMLDVGGRPMLCHLIEQFRDQGFFKFILCVNYKKEVISQYFGDGSNFGVSITYIEEEKRLGTAGALSLMSNIDISESFFVVNADVLTSLSYVDMLDFHSKNKAEVTMCVRTYDYTIPYGVVVSDENGNVESLYEKPTQSFNVNAGIYVVSKAALQHIPINTFYDMPSLILKISGKNGAAKVYPMRDYWIDIGKKEDLLKAQNDLSLFA
ncbi:nucleotidyltransferase family protein [Sansalvadorimonas sp. 2012CJ34-2]|uniref:Nucleotidyltransferase family protein n=1 Tax=Parendozoicomonas callyspongiae TaxID=2942213 RepID=A0ABT0PKW9_9GAMM|nr:nucleotidyltransferase family protein [Sansalvadorimonas sp. 2012CJ34-2]MCL6272037.1 nucleotidyltransferase family protein [Sansalvadorimonas sp. 2012CJ34-2]